MVGGDGSFGKFFSRLRCRRGGGCGFAHKNQRFEDGLRRGAEDDTQGGVSSQEGNGFRLAAETDRLVACAPRMKSFSRIKQPEHRTSNLKHQTSDSGPLDA